MIPLLIAMLAQNVPHNCGSAEDGLRVLKENFHETMKWTGEDKDKNRWILTTSDKGGWTISMVPHGQNPDQPQMMCIMTSDGGTGDQGA